MGRTQTVLPVVAIALVVVAVLVLLNLYGYLKGIPYTPSSGSPPALHGY